jgi:hypothetical protein
MFMFFVLLDYASALSTLVPLTVTGFGSRITTLGSFTGWHSKPSRAHGAEPKEQSDRSTRSGSHPAACRTWRASLCGVLSEMQPLLKGSGADSRSLARGVSNFPPRPGQRVCARDGLGLCRGLSAPGAERGHSRWRLVGGVLMGGRNR